MYNIHIIEDQELYAQKLTSLVQSFDNISFTIDRVTETRTNFETFVSTNVKGSSSYNIYLMDVNLRTSINGFELAKAIRTTDFLGYIIFLTSHSEMATMSFDYHLKAINFIDKSDPDMNLKLKDTFKQIVFENKHHHAEDVLIIKSRNKVIQLNCDDILYIETSHIKRTLYIHTTNHRYTYHGTLKEILVELPNNFKRCHKSFILNAKNMTELDISTHQYQVYFNQNKSCFISKKYIPNPLKLLKLKELYEL